MRKRFFLCNGHDRSAVSAHIQTSTPTEFMYQTVQPQKCGVIEHVIVKTLKKRSRNCAKRGKVLQAQAHLPTVICFNIFVVHAFRVTINF